MNWQDWYKTIPKLTKSEAKISVISWDKCKEEVLKILKTLDTTKTRSNKKGWHWHTINKEDVIEEIKKL